MASIGSEDCELNPSKYAAKAWLCSSILRCGLYPKAIYMELGVDQSTFSRWMSLEHDQVMPMEHLPAVLSMLDSQAMSDLIAILQPNGKAPVRARA